MKRTFEFLSQSGLSTSVRLLLFLAIMPMQTREALAQDTTLARIPQVELIPVQQREALDHYIEKAWISGNLQMKAFDGARELVLSFGENALVSVSPNQRYFTVAKPVASPKGGTMAYDVELRDVSNSVLAKGRMPSLGSDGEEAHDDFVPTDDGLGILHQAHLALSGGLHFVFLKRKSSSLLRQFEVDKTAFWNGNLSYEPTQKMFVATYEGHMPGTKISQTHVQCYSPNGTLHWETVLDSQHVISPLFISAFDGTIAFVCRNVRDRTHNNLFIFKKNGKLIRLLPVYHIGSYELAHFRLIKGIQYFLCSSGVEYYYIVNTDSCTIINYQTQAKEGTRVMGLSPYRESIITTYYTLYTRPGPNNTKEPYPKEQGLGIMDLYGQIIYVPLNLTGLPFLYYTEDGLFLREQVGFGLNPQNNFYKVEIK
ncbi:MAG: hypothetical protein KF734_06425 [Saprospiraceae bacterium]|nr:hypothetical protein [Saprospiraceae bacterium]